MRTLLVPSAFPKLDAGGSWSLPTPSASPPKLPFGGLLLGPLPSILPTIHPEISHLPFWWIRDRSSPCPRTSSRILLLRLVSSPLVFGRTPTLVSSCLESAAVPLRSIAMALDIAARHLASCSRALGASGLCPCLRALRQPRYSLPHLARLIVVELHGTFL